MSEYDELLARKKVTYPTFPLLPGNWEKKDADVSPYKDAKEHVRSDNYDESQKDKDPSSFDDLFFEPFRPYERAIKDWIDGTDSQPGLYIRRHNSEQTEEPKKVKVIRSGGEKAYQEAIAELRNKRTQVPIIAYRMTGFNYEQTRFLPHVSGFQNYNTAVPIEWNDDGTIIKMQFNPIPISINYSFDIWCRYWQELNQIMYWFQSQFNPNKFFVVHRSWCYLETMVWSDASNFEPAQDVDRLIRYSGTSVFKNCVMPVGIHNVKTAITFRNEIVDKKTGDTLQTFDVTPSKESEA